LANIFLEKHSQKFEIKLYAQVIDGINFVRKNSGKTLIYAHSAVKAFVCMVMTKMSTIKVKRKLFD
jgi:hypothetical protein